MPTKFSGRLTLIFVVLVVAVICIIPPDAMFNSKLSFWDRTEIKPGIDMVGGVSLIYKIKPPQEKGGGLNTGASDLAEQVMEALKKRVDPNGVRNLVWRPIGSDELEIQMPLTSKSADAPKIRQEFVEAQTQLEATNIRAADVLDAIAMPKSADRDTQLTNLSQGDPKRLELFQSLADMNDQINAAKLIVEPPSGAAHPAPTAEQMHHAVQVLDEVGEKLEEGKTHIEDENVTVSDLETIIEGLPTDPNKFGPLLSDLKSRWANFASRMAALDKFQAAYTNYLTVRSTLDDSADLKALLKGSGVLEFHIVAYDTTDPRYTMMYERMKPGGRGPNPQQGDTTYRWFQVDRKEEFDHPGEPQRTVEWNGKYYILCLITPDASMTKSQQWALERAFPETDPNTGLEEVGFTFDVNGGHIFGELTSKWKPNGAQEYQLASILDDKVITAPNIQSAITEGSGVITGQFTQSDVNYMVDTLNAGSLPAQLEDEPISERRVGSTLGADNLRKGLVACGFGLVVVAVFLIGYYYIAGAVAFLAIIMNLVLILGALAALGATFTLPSIAAIVLSVGTAVDANVLIFERLREEQHRGLSLKMALRNSYDRAFSAIIDSNMTSVITSAFLYMTGSEEVKGFGLTLIIGIIASLFTALFVTKTVFGIMIEKFGVKDLGSFPLTFPKWDKFLKPNIDWMGLAWIFYTFSIIGITSGLILFGIYTERGKMMDIEFAAGTSVEFELVKPMDIGSVRSIIEKTDKDALPAPSVVSVGTDQTAYQVVTTSQDAATVKRVVVETLGSLLKTQLPSRFDGVDDKTVTEAMAHDVVFPVPDDLRQWPYGAAPSQARDYAGGVAIRLMNLNPPLSAAEIKKRIDNDRPQTPGADKLASIAVVAPGPDDRPVTNALILVSHPSVVYSPEREGDWRTELASPAWTLVRGAVNHEATLRGVNSFNASVAGDAKRDATIALTLSILVIMAYIWIRFGNLKYGTATMVALLHDTIFTLAAVGYAHLLADTTIAQYLELEPFRVNLTMVAGILTIMSYSMIDTIVVFDRIRENRGKFGHLSRTVVNDAINQTLSRTLLTCGTTTMTVAFMYFMGGAGIHGFTFVLLIGILVGTYSSVAIAAPLLLIGSDVQKTPPPGGSASQNALAAQAH